MQSLYTAYLNQDQFGSGGVNEGAGEQEDTCNLPRVLSSQFAVRAGGMLPYHSHLWAYLDSELEWQLALAWVPAWQRGRLTSMLLLL